MTTTSATAPTQTPLHPLLPLLDQLAAGRDLTALRTLVQDGESSGEDGSIVAPTGLFPFAVADLAREASAERPLIVVTPTTRALEDLRAALSALIGTDHVAELPAWETLPHERLSPRADTVAKRLATLRRIAHPETETPVHVLLMPVRSLLQPIAKGLGDLRPLRADVGDTYPLDEIVRDLVDAAYVRVDMVEKRGEFAVRGGILDVFPPTEPHPLRVDLFGDEIDEVRYFSIADQRSLDPAPGGLDAPPCREILLTPEVRDRARAMAEELPGARDLLLRIANGIAADGMESLSPVLVDGMEQVADVLPENARFLVLDPEKTRSRAEELVATTEEFLAAAWSSAAAGGGLPIDVGDASFVPLSEAKGHAREGGRAWFTLAPFGLDPDLDLTSTSHTHPGYSGKPGDAAKDLERRRQDGWSVVATMVGPGGARHVTENLRAEGMPAVFSHDLEGHVAPGEAVVTVGPFPDGLIVDDLRLILASERDLTGKSGARRAEDRKMPSRRRNVVDPLQLRPGDHVVHAHHGVGRFVEMTSRTVGTGAKRTTREYLVIEYAASKKGQPGDRLYVPSDQLDQVTKYVGGEEPSVNRMGGSDWAKTKSRARKAIREIADELVRLYSARQSAPGHAFGPDTPWQRELEDAFEFVETPDQLVTIEDVKSDMQKTVPMDRLILGDVGYGKTEIAVRAAFKAVQDGKQVALLAPTTLLAQQHLDTFAERYTGFPVTVRGLSRFQSAADSQQTIEGVADGSVDIVIGTHRLLTGQVRFKDLGLLIIDEEQRFGVEHKETLKALRTDVDVLAMSATPIPRTLEMAVTGIREMSILATPPEERHPVLTYVGAQEDKQVAAAIRRELLREGQVFYIHNRVEDIDRVAAHLRELVPDARVQVAHGKMNETQLERVIIDFWERDFDVLVCTTIVETGLDIANANTLIVENADKFGLSQLHQLRGRVGRSSERAYSYFLYNGSKPLTETAHDRLTTLATNTDLGAGMQVAMKDLEIRGAGNLLGGEQSGHIAGVGFDLYVRMVGEAVAAFRGESSAPEKEIRVELPLDAHVPHDYIGSERLRLEAYSKLSAVREMSEIEQIRAELTDRYGTPPAPVEVLLDVARFRIDARSAGIDEVQAQGKMIRFAHLEVPDSAAMRMKRLYPGTMLKPATRQVLVPRPMTSRFGGTELRDHELLEWAREVMRTLIPSAADSISRPTVQGEAK
ncbi:transcription-repair coupling factor [Brachybacterium alimentarium]|uniref:transcription-repair coupling factor n=1 Tax=Brachybacterium alimentarium TaxID=47845 RepID=UPI000DF279C3|nr:transcription-repair coupling factor [Brachybacterium alimentarium]RCS76463.1 transcription-repair coupling factor [Brachybacterium alimentarium]RCS79684.1 transcription-repair coupling factor [Brachybacterium alimentarium]